MLAEYLHTVDTISLPDSIQSRVLGLICKHCGCTFGKHRGGTETEPFEARRKCPPIAELGKPYDMPYGQGLAAFDRYWSTAKVFEVDDSG